MTHIRRTATLRHRGIGLLAAAAACGPAGMAGAAELRLELIEAAPFQAGDTVTVHVLMADLGGTEAIGFQAFLGFDSAELTFVAGTYLPVPFGQPVIPIIVAVGEDIDMASGVDFAAGQPGTSADSHLVTLVFEAASDFCLPAIEFRDHQPPSRITDDQGVPLEPLDLVVIGPANDCNGNDIEDACDIEDGTSRDCNINGVPDECETLTCPADFTGPSGMPDGQVDIFEFLSVIGLWGTRGCADFTGPLGEPDGEVNIYEFLSVIGLWGPCP